jgi:hypothetical protein
VVWVLAAVMEVVAMDPKMPIASPKIVDKGFLAGQPPA